MDWSPRYPSKTFFGQIDTSNYDASPSDIARVRGQIRKANRERTQYYKDIVKQNKGQLTARSVKKRDITNVQWYLLGILIFLLIGAGIGVGIWFVVKSANKDKDKNSS